jgi:hypothetical protein
MPLSREPFFLRMVNGVAGGHGFEPQSDLELSFAEILINLEGISNGLRSKLKTGPMGLGLALEVHVSPCIV